MPNRKTNARQFLRVFVSPCANHICINGRQTISFDDLEGYDNDSLQDIFNRNMMLEFKRNEVKANTKNKIAISLICIGLLFFIQLGGSLI